MFILWKQRCWLCFSDRSFWSSVLAASVLLMASLIINYYAAIYAAEQASNPVTDIVLSNIPVFKVDDIFVYGPIVFFTFIGYLCASEPRKIPFIFNSIALFVLIRAVFISLTHLGPFPTAVTIESHFLRDFSSGSDLFFSGHTGLPFLMALVFWRYLYLRLLFIFTAVIFGIIVLMGHLHYSIDVLSAFFITYSIYHLARYFFAHDYRLFEGANSPKGV